MTSIAKGLLVVSLFTWMVAVDAPLDVDSIPLAHAVGFEILNDDQSIAYQSVSDGAFPIAPIAGSDYVARPNVRLNGWYFDQALTELFDFEQDAIVEPLTLYAEWVYLKDSVSKATLTQSQPGSNFEVGTIELFLVLYAPMQVDLQYQWQQKLPSGLKWIDILGATEASYQPRQNGTYEFRILYWVQEEDNQGVLETVRKESQPVTLTLSGAFDWQPLLYLFGVIIIGGGLFAFYRKQKLSYVVAGGDPIPPKWIRPFEDISLQPKATKKGYTFVGWYLDAPMTLPFEGMRMPQKALVLYAKFQRKK